MLLVNGKNTWALRLAMSPASVVIKRRSYMYSANCLAKLVWKMVITVLPPFELPIDLPGPLLRA